MTEQQLWQQLVPFKLNRQSASLPTSIQFRVLLDGSIFSYTLEADSSRVHHERLEQIPPGSKRTRLLFDRQWNSGEGRYDWKNGAAFAGPHTQLEPQLREQGMFLRMLCTQLKVAVIEPLSLWLQEQGASVILDNPRQIAAASLIYAFPQFQRSMAAFVRDMDTGITHVEWRTNNERSKESPEPFQLITRHDSSDGPVDWLLKEESTGTQYLFGISYQVTLGLENGALVILDEFGANIHPALTRRIIRLFQNPETNPKRAQLLFTTHDNTLQRGQLLRRDQIWFTEKQRDGSTSLYALSDFKVRNDLAIDQAYLDGRFGAVPSLPEETEMLPKKEESP
jgi:hypothetical protein